MMNVHSFSLHFRARQILRPNQRWLFATQMNQYSTSNEAEPNNESSTAEDDDTYVDDIKNKILSASMVFVNEHGWTKESLASGAQALGYASTSHSLFPHGAAHLVHHHTLSCNTRLAEKLEEISKSTKQQNHIQFIEDAIITRIEMLEPYKTSWPTALGLVMNSKMSLKHIEAILRLADDICYHSSDRSVNEHWYLRRLAVAGIYQASEMHWLGNDAKSPETALVDTRKFTANQLKCATTLYDIPKNISAVLTMIRNIVPVNFNR